MKPFRDRESDNQYQQTLGKIYNNGRKVRPIQGDESRMILGGQLRYNLKNGFPLITDRDISGSPFKQALGEHIGFLNGARTQADLEKFGCKWWKDWVSPKKCADFGLPPGDLGDGSYGAAWTAFPTKEGQPFDQIENVIKQIKWRPYLRTHRITPWIPQYAIQHDELRRKVVVAPCHGDIHIMVYPNDKEFDVHHIQRSGDFPVGVPFNMIQYAAFGLMLEKILDYRFNEIVYTFSDHHIYERQYSHVEELLKREPRRLPTVTLNVKRENIKDYRLEDFELTDYEPHPAMRIPTPL